MAQLSRPFQIALVAVLLLAGVLLVALQGHSSSPTSSISSPAVSASAPATSTPASPSTTTSTPSSPRAAKAAPSHASGSSLGGLSRAIDRAHHAAAVTQHHEQQVEAKSAQASNEPAPTTTSSSQSATPATTTTAPATSSPAKSVAKTPAQAPASSAHKSASSPGTSTALAKPSGQVAIEADLAKGNVVVLLFWNPAGTDDVVAHQAVQAISHTQKHVAVKEASASQVANFGSITRGVQIYQTPTILVINKSGQTLVLTGSQDAFSIEQTIAEARS
jgi:hypothetical protein